MKHYLAILTGVLLLANASRAADNITAEDEKYIRQTIDLALSARKHGNGPFGALLVYQGKVLITAENSSHTEPNATGHAETNLIRLASKKYPREVLEKCTLYTSTEPCMMCTGAIYWGWVPKIVFGCSAETLADSSGMHEFVIPTKTLYAKAHTKRIEVVGPVLEKEALVPHQGFWDKFKH
jgi:tRNA(Arg) A34 adenosine deaminase TadA